MKDERWMMDYKRWMIDDERLKMKYEKWKMKDWRWKMKIKIIRCTCHCVRLCICVSMCLSIYQSIYLLIHRSIYLARLLIYDDILIYIYMCVCVYIYIYIDALWCSGIKADFSEDLLVRPMGPLHGPGHASKILQFQQTLCHSFTESGKLLCQ